MVLNNIFYNSNVFLYIYMFVYNTALTSLFFIILSSVLSNFKTLHSFSNFNFDSFYTLILSTCLFSLAGVPPFLGFFSKLFILNLVSNSNFMLFYYFLFFILFLSLYFYIQNLRFLHSTNFNHSTQTYVFNENKCLFIHYFLLSSFIFLSSGFFLIDDLLLIFMWLTY